MDKIENIRPVFTDFQERFGGLAATCHNLYCDGAFGKSLDI
jgi:hypothetical protein